VILLTRKSSTMNVLWRITTKTFCGALIFALISACQPSSAPMPKPESPEPPPPGQVVAPGRPDITNESVATPEKNATIPRFLPESIISAPEKDLASRRLEYNTSLSSRTVQTGADTEWRYRITKTGHIVGFEFSNHGGNRILAPQRDAPKNIFFTRDFQFRFDERARQDINLMVTDWVPSRDRQFRLSELMNSIFHLFPRNYLPAIATLNGRNTVTLPTGEEIEFNAKTHEIIGGAMSESPVDLNPDRSARRFPSVEYTGKGILVRANSRGSDPRFGTTATISTGTPTPNCDKGLACNQCQVPARELWDQSGAERFKFPTDQEFDRFLLARCGFGLPRNQTGYAIAAR